MLFRWFLAVLLFQAARAQAGGVYWTDRGASRLMRMNFDGSSLQTLALSGTVTDPGTNLRGLAVDATGERLYWADNGRDQIHRARLDGSGSELFLALTNGNSFPADLRLDAHTRLLFWCDQTRGLIQRSTLDTPLAVDVITNAAISGPYFLDLDSTTGKIYWGDFSGGAIYRANLDGSSRESLLTGNASTRGVRVDPAAGMLYWLDRDLGRLLRCPLTELGRGPLSVTNPVVQTLYTNLDTPHGLALDVLARKLYWADTGTNPGEQPSERAINRGDIDGSTPVETLATGEEPWDVDLDLRCTDYAQWRARFFRRDAPPSVTDRQSDPDGDGLPNAVEYAQGTSPLVPDSTIRPRGELVPEANTIYPAIRFRQQPSARDLAYRVQGSDTATPWPVENGNDLTTLVSQAPTESGLEDVLVRSRIPLLDRPAQFLRVQFELTLAP